MAEVCEVFLNVYDLHDSNGALHTVGMGFYHTGVEVRGWEYSFSDSGIHRTRPRLPEFGNFREQISMGIYTGSINEVNNVVTSMGCERFAPGRYNLTSLNCNHFSDALCQLLTAQRIPDWINRMAGIGSTFAPTVSKPNTNNATSSSGGTSFAAPGVVSSPTDPVPVKSTTAGLPVTKSSSSSTRADESKTADGGSVWTSSLFSWFGGGGASSSNNSIATSSAGATTTPVTATTTKSKAAGETTKKELTEKQKALLQKMKGGQA